MIMNDATAAELITLILMSPVIIIIVFECMENHKSNKK